MSAEITQTIKYVCDGDDCDKSFLITLGHGINTQHDLDNLITQTHGWSIMNCGTTNKHYCHFCCVTNNFPLQRTFDVRETL